MFLRSKLRESGVHELIAFDKDLQYMHTFNRGKRIASGLAAAWQNQNRYAAARNIVHGALATDQILSGSEKTFGNSCDDYAQVKRKTS